MGKRDCFFIVFYGTTEAKELLELLGEVAGILGQTVESVDEGDNRCGSGQV